MCINHEKFMKLALEQAHLAEQHGEVPVGAILIDQKQIILATGFNQPITLCDPTAHAEIVALRSAANQTRNYRLLSTTLYVTVEPCVMCMGALIHARVNQVVFGAFDTKWGAAGSLYNFSNDNRFNHQIEIVPGICEVQCRDMIVDFFRQKRQDNQREGRFGSQKCQSLGFNYLNTD